MICRMDSERRIKDKLSHLINRWLFFKNQGTDDYLLTMQGCMESAIEFFQNNDTIDDKIKMQIFFDEKVKNVKQFVTEFLSYYNMND